MNSIELRKAIRAKYAWPGGYPMYVVMSDGEALCMCCARKEYRQLAYSNRHNLRDGWKPEGVDINYEDTALYCAHCNVQIESAYGE
jgi:ferredoxin